MYQLVDDPTDIERETALARADARQTLWIWLAIGVALLAFVTAVSDHNETSKAVKETISPVERANYRKAIGEEKTDLRRARLRDFEITYPRSQLLTAVRAQLYVLDSHEAKDWAALSHILYEPSASRIRKLAAIQVYEGKWGAGYIGGREDTLQALRDKLSPATTAPTTKAIKPRKMRGLVGGSAPKETTSPQVSPTKPTSADSETSIFETSTREATNPETPQDLPPPNETSDDVMVGGLPTPPAEPAPALKTPTPKVSDQPRIVSPRVQKNVTPVYPRNAYRRSINAVVELSLSIDAEGKVQAVEVLNVQAEKYKKKFTKASERAAKQTRYSPKTINGKAVPAQGVRKRYVFRMN